MRNLDSPTSWALLARNWALGTGGQPREAAPHTMTVWAVQRLTLGKHSRRLCHTTCRRPPREGTAHLPWAQGKACCTWCARGRGRVQAQNRQAQPQPNTAAKGDLRERESPKKAGVARQGCQAACGAGTRGAHGHKSARACPADRHHTTLLATTKPKDHGLRSIQCTALTGVPSRSNVPLHCVSPQQAACCAFLIRRR